MSTKRIVSALSVAATLALAVPASAGMIDNDYEGRAEKDKTTFVGFDVAKKHGVQKVSRVTGVLHYHCSGSGTDPTFGVRSRGSLKVKDNRFGGTLQIPIRKRGGFPSSAKFVIHGKLAKNGKASGEIESIVIFPSAKRGVDGPPEGRCYTGGLSFKVKKGADVGVPPLRERTQLSNRRVG